METLEAQLWQLRDEVYSFSVEHDRCQKILKSKKGDSYVYQYMNATRSKKYFTCLTRSGQKPVQEPAQSRRQGRMMIYVRMNISCNRQSVRGRCRKQSLFCPELSPRVMSQNSLSSTAALRIIMQWSYCCEIYLNSISPNHNLEVANSLSQFNARGEQFNPLLNSSQLKLFLCYCNKNLATILPLFLHHNNSPSSAFCVSVITASKLRKCGICLSFELEKGTKINGLKKKRPICTIFLNIFKCNIQFPFQQ